MTEDKEILKQLDLIRQNVDHVKGGVAKGSYDYDNLSKILFQIDSLVRSIKVRMEFYCPVCEKRFATEKEQLTHYDNEHGITENNKIAT